MEDQTTDLSASQQPAGTTKIENGIAYDISGKPLGPANVPDEKETPAALAPPPGFKPLAAPPGFKPALTMLQPPPGFKPAPAVQPLEQPSEDEQLKKQGWAVPSEEHGWLYNNIGAGLYNDVKRVKDAILAGEGPGWLPYDIAQKFNPPPKPPEATDEEAIGRLKARNASTEPDQVAIEKERINRSRQDAVFEARNAKEYAEGPQKLVSPEKILTAGERKDHPYLYGVLHAIGGLTTEDNALLFAGSAGAGAVASAVEESPAIMQAANPIVRTVGAAITKIPRAISLYFAGGMANGVWKQLPEVIQGKKDYDAAVAAGDQDKADQILRDTQEKAAELATNSYFAWAAAYHGVTGEAEPVARNVADITSQAADVAGKKGMEAIDKTAAAVKAAPKAIGKAVDVGMGKPTTFVDAVMRTLNVSEKQKPVMRKKVEAVESELQAIYNKNKDTVEDPATFADAIEKHNRENEMAMQNAAGATRDSSEPVVADFSQRVSDRLDKFFADNKGRYSATDVAEAKKKILDKILQSRNGQHLQEPNLFEADNVRQGLNEDSRTAYDIGTKKFMPRNAYQAAAAEAANITRDAIDESYHNHRVENVQEFRSKEAPLIDVVKGLRDMQGKSEAAGQPGWMKAILNKATGLESGIAIGATILGHTPLGAAALVPAIIGNKIYQNRTNPIANIERAGELASPTAQATEVNVRPPTPPPVNHKLYAALSSYYGKIVGAVPFEDLENQFMAEVQHAETHAIPQDQRQRMGELLQRVNDAKATQRELIEKQQQKAAQDQMKAAEKASVEQQKAIAEQQKAKEEEEAKKKEQAAAGLVTATHPPFETTEHLPVPARYSVMGYTPQRVGTHELAHQIMADEFGHGTGDIINHKHDQIDSGALAEARWEKTNLVDEDGNIKLEKLPEILAILHGGPVAEELVHGVPIHENPANDIEIARSLVKEAGFTPAETGIIMKAAEMKAREVLTAPGVTDIIKRYTEHRQAGIDKDTHMSAETVGQAVQEVRHARGKNATTDNEARVGKEDKTGTPGDESGGKGAAKGEPKKPVQPAGKGGASAGAGGGKETKTNIKPGAGAESGDGEEGSDRRLAEPGQPELAYRARATGEQGIPATGRPVATSSLESAQRYAENLEDMTGKPHEVVQFPLKGQKFKAHEGPHGDTWFEMHEAVPESAVNKGVPNTNIKVPEQPHKQRFEINVTRDGETKPEPIEAYSRAEAFKTAQKKFPDAQEFNLAKDYGETLPREQGYVVPTGKHLNTPNSRTGVSPVENTMVHELGHYMVGHNEGLKSYGVLRHTHPDMGRNSNAAVSWDTSDLYDPATRKYKTDKLPSILRMAMGGIAADEAFSNVPRGENNNFDPQRGGDGSMSVRLLRAAGYQEPVITQMMHTAIDQAKEHLTQKPVADIIQENKGTREPNLSKQFHYGPARLRAMGDEAARRLNEGNYRAGVGEGNAAGGANVAGREGEAAGAVGQRVQTNQVSVPPERTTGVPEHDAAIKAGGGVPGGVTDFGEYGKIFNFHDPQTGSTLGFKEGQPITPESVKAQIQKSRDAFAAGEAKNREIKTNIKADRVSTRLPEGKDAKENALQGEPLVIGREALKNTPAKLQQKFADTVRDYPGVKIPGTLKDPQKVMDRFVNHVKDNLKFLYDQVEPEKQVANAKWYESANKLSKELAGKHGISEPQAAATIATQSPQKDWDMNVSLARRIADIHSNHQDTVTTPEMLQKGHDIVKNTGANKDLDGVIDKLEGKKLSELTDPVERAAWVRLYDEAHNTRDFHYIDPGTGENRGLRTNADGKPSKVAWGSLPQIDNALSVLKDGSRENISERLGGMHKVRNFFNNIIDPTNDQDVTIDTHAVAAGLIQPLGGNAKEVLDNFGKAGKHTGTGVKGTYPLYADAYRQAAQEIGIKPRELQSVVWEHVRNMFPSEWKSPENEKLVKGIWQKYSDGKQSLDKTRQQILKISEEAQKGVNETREAAQKKALDKQAKLGHNSGVKALGGE